MSDPANAHALWLEADTTGLYQRVRQWTGQPPRHGGKERLWHLVASAHLLTTPDNDTGEEGATNPI